MNSDLMNSTDNNDSEESIVRTIIMGVIGAILGTVPATILYIALGRIGIIAALCGYFMIMGEMFACDFMTRKSKDMNFETAAAICVIVMTVTIYNCEKFLWARAMFNMPSTDHTFLDCFINFGKITEELDIWYDFISSLIPCFAMTAIGAIAGFASLMKIAKK